MHRFIKFALTAAALCVPFVPAEAGKKDNTLVWATDRENSITDSNYLNTRELVIMGTLIYDRLIHLDEEYDPKPLLATAWTWVNDTTLDLDIRKGVKFHSGKDLDADDVVYTISFLINRDHGALSYSYVS
jgi:peptide/nickel transport system substrate-binding protein